MSEQEPDAEAEAIHVRVERWRMEKAPRNEVDVVVQILQLGMQRQIPPHEESTSRIRKMVQKWLSVAGSGVLLAMDGQGSIYGCAVCRREPPAARLVYISTVEPALGIGTAIIEKLISLSEGDGLTEIRATYSPEDPAHVAFFLQKLGFDPGEPARRIRGVQHYDGVLHFSEV